MRALATALMSVAMALGALGLALAAPHRGRAPEPKAAAGGASGALKISNSRAGQAVFSAAGLRPGQSAVGSVRIGNAGEVAGRFSVRPTDVEDVPAPYGGLLSQRVQLALVDVTRAHDPRTLYAGTPAAFATVDLGTFEPGTQRDYRLAATMPVGGLSDNAFQGSALRLGLEWRASAPGDAGVTVTPPAPDAPPATAPPATAPPGGTDALPGAVASATDSLGLPPAGACFKRRRLTVRLTAPGGARVLAATVKVNGKVKARVRGAKPSVRVTLRRLPARRIRVEVRVSASNGRSYTSKRSYRACKPAKAATKRKR